MIIKKRFGDRNFVQYLGLKNDDYALVPKKKKKQKVYIPGVSVTYRNDPGSQAELEAQQMANSVRFIPHKYEDQRAYRYTAKALPPVVHSYDRMGDTDGIRLLTMNRRNEDIKNAYKIQTWKRLKKGYAEFGRKLINKARARQAFDLFRQQPELVQWYRGTKDKKQQLLWQKMAKEAEEERLRREEARIRYDFINLMTKRNQIRHAGRTILKAFREYNKRESPQQQMFEKRLQKALARSSGTLNFATDNKTPFKTGGVPRVSLSPNASISPAFTSDSGILTLSKYEPISPKDPVGGPGASRRISI